MPKFRSRFTRNWDADEEAKTDGTAIFRMRKVHDIQTPVTRAKAKRGTVRGTIGAKARRGLLFVPIVGSTPVGIVPTV